jgi:hypothetical protein
LIARASTAPNCALLCRRNPCQPEPLVILP